MKLCRSCGALNRDDSRFCSSCGSAELEPCAEAPARPSTAPIAAPDTKYPRREFTKFDLCTIFGFVSSIVGLFQISLILEPLALATSILGFSKGKRYRGLAIAGVVISSLGLLLRLFSTLYLNGIVPRWLITGTFE